MLLICKDDVLAGHWIILKVQFGPVTTIAVRLRITNRQYSDEQILRLVQRGAVIGGAMDAWMMVPGWVRGVSDPLQMNCNLEKLLDHMDHICQLAGNALHIGIGSDLDGAFGREQSPYDLRNDPR